MFLGRLLVVVVVLFVNAHLFVPYVFVSSWETSTPDETKQLQSVHVGVILDVDSNMGSMAEICLAIALDDFYDAHRDYKTRMVFQTRSSVNVVSAAAAAIDLLETGEVVAIIGPQSSCEATFVTELGRNVQVPIMPFSVTTPSISHAKNPYFIRTARNDSYQVQAITELFQGFGWLEVVLIYEDTTYGNGIIPYLTDALQKSGVKITYKCALLKQVNKTMISQELRKMKRVNTRVFLVHMMSTSLGSALFEQADDIGLMAEGCAWIITDGLSNSLDDLVPIAVDSMDGVLGIRPHIPKSLKQEHFKARWKRQFHSVKPDSPVSELNIFGLWAYDTVWTLATAVEGIWPLQSHLYIKSTRNATNPITNLGMSVEGPRLLHGILNSKPLEGVSGKFHIVDGQLEPLALEIFNVIGNGERVIGYWTPRYGLSRSVHSPQPNSSIHDLRKIIWPGDSTAKPLGLGNTPARRLRIGVPAGQLGFNGMVGAEVNQNSSEFLFKGYCVDMFKAAVDALPDHIEFKYELIPYHPSGRNSFTRKYNYDQLLFEVYNKTFDAVVGDTTISADRSYVDFTLPYSDVGVSMVVPLVVPRNSADWFLFMRPFGRGLWAAVAVAFLVTLFAVYFLQSGPSGDGTTRSLLEPLIAIPLSLITRRTESQVWGLHSRLVVLVWLLGMGVLTACYVASFSSIVEAESRDWGIDLNEMGVRIGYQQGSGLVEDMLLNKLHIDESRIKAYASMEQYDQALSKGSAKGGVSAIMDETPYLRLFLAKYGSKYKIAGPTYKSNGFGFAFSMGSPLVSEMSKAILNVSGSDRTKKIEEKYFKSTDFLENQSCTSKPTSSYALRLADFAGLFLAKAVLLFLILLVPDISVDGWQRLWQQTLVRLQRLWQWLKHWIRDRATHVPGRATDSTASTT